MARCWHGWPAPARWLALMRKGMAQEVSWLAPAQAYKALYEKLR